jgi:hypothetical protein
MRRNKAHFFYAGMIAAALISAPMIAFAQPGAAPPTPEEGISGSSGGSLSHQLNRSGGVIHPPANLDPGLTKPAPELGPHSMPVIPPPGTPGGNPDIKPK